MKQRKYLWAGIILILVISLAVFYKYNKYPYINEKIRNAVETGTDSLYKISYDSISVKELEPQPF